MAKTAKTGKTAKKSSAAKKSISRKKGVASKSKKKKVKKAKTKKAKAKKAKAKKTKRFKTSGKVLETTFPVKKSVPPYKCRRTLDGCLKFYPDSTGAYNSPRGGERVDCSTCRYWF